MGELVKLAAKAIDAEKEKRRDRPQVTNFMGRRRQQWKTSNGKSYAVLPAGEVAELMREKKRFFESKKTEVPHAKARIMGALQEIADAHKRHKHKRHKRMVEHGE